MNSKLVTLKGKFWDDRKKFDDESLLISRERERLIKVIKNALASYPDVIVNCVLSAIERSNP